MKSKAGSAPMPFEEVVMVMIYGIKRKKGKTENENKWNFDGAPFYSTNLNFCKTIIYYLGNVLKLIQNFQNNILKKIKCKITSKTKHFYRSHPWLCKLAYTRVWLLFWNRRACHVRAPFEFAPVFHKNCSQSELSIFPVHTINLSYCVECVQFC